jgi:DNA polymerase-3 subunit alpha
VAWSLTITDLDPIKLNLLFERFLNPERVSMPDFDIDFCETRRGEVIRYVQQRYGSDKVAQIITFGKLKARAVLKDTGRVLQMSYGQVDRLAKLVPNHPTDPWTLDRALNGVSELAAEYKNDQAVRRLFDLAMKLEGLPRHSSTHAAGVVIGDRPLQALVPLYRDPRSDMPVTQFDMKYVEGAGLVKFDFLGLKTLSVLQKAVQMLGQARHRGRSGPLAWDDPGGLPAPPEGRHGRRLPARIRRHAPHAGGGEADQLRGHHRARLALSGPARWTTSRLFGARKNGREPIEYPHPLLEDVLKETYGIFVYQEQVMQAAQVLAGYCLGEADLLRRAMGKKIKAEMDAQRERLRERLRAAPDRQAQGERTVRLDRQVCGLRLQQEPRGRLCAHRLPDRVAEGASSGRILRRLHVLRHGADRQARHLRRRHAAAGGRLPAPVDQPQRGGVRGRADRGGPGRALCARRAEGCRRERRWSGSSRSGRRKGGTRRWTISPIGSIPKLLNRRQIESLAAGGAFDQLAPNRAAVHAAAETILAHASSAANARTSGQGGLFGEGAANVVPIRMPAKATWSLAERMSQEKEAFGFYFSAHPVDNYRHLALAHGAKSFAELGAVPAPADGGRSGAVMAGLIEDTRWRTSAKGRVLMATVSDSSGQFDATVFDDAVAIQVEEAAKAGGAAAQCRARPAPRGGSAAGHDQVDPELRESRPSHASTDRGRCGRPRRTAGTRRRACRSPRRQRPAAPARADRWRRRGRPGPRPRLHARRGACGAARARAGRDRGCACGRGATPLGAGLLIHTVRPELER